jgi:hypothetical protein
LVRERILSGGSSSFGVVGGELRKDRGSNSRAKRECADLRSNGTYPPSSLSRAFGRVSGLPLGAKIAGTLVVAGVAWFVMLVGFLRLLEGRSQIIKGGGYLVIGAIMWIGSGAFWWAGGY